MLCFSRWSNSVVFWMGITAVICAPGSFSWSDDEIDVDPTKPNRLILHVCKMDGTPIRPLVADKAIRHDLDRQGTPNVSPDGKRVAYDAWSTTPTDPDRGPRVCVCDLDGKNFIDVIDGYMPSFAPDNKRLVVSRPAKYAKADGAEGQSIWIVNCDTKEKKLIADQGAWGGRWSADGATILFQGGVDDNGDPVPKSCLRVYDVAAEKPSLLFPPEGSPFQEISYHFAWSKSDRRLAIGGRLIAGLGEGAPSSATVIMNADKGPDSVTIMLPPANGARVFDGLSLDWHPDGKSILSTGMVDNRFVPVGLSTDGTASEITFPGIPDSVNVRDPAYSPDGKHLIASFGARP